MPISGQVTVAQRVVTKHVDKRAESAGVGGGVLAGY
jgi:hypothetical protein